MHSRGGRRDFHKQQNRKQRHSERSLREVQHKDDGERQGVQHTFAQRKLLCHRCFQKVRASHNRGESCRPGESVGCRKRRHDYKDCGRISHQQYRRCLSGGRYIRSEGCTGIDGRRISSEFYILRKLRKIFGGVLPKQYVFLHASPQRSDKRHRIQETVFPCFRKRGDRAARQLCRFYKSGQNHAYVRH